MTLFTSSILTMAGFLFTNLHLHFHWLRVLLKYDHLTEQFQYQSRASMSFPAPGSNIIILVKNGNLNFKESVFGFIAFLLI